ncbi:Putative peptidoglycan binding domain-containing protein [Clostridium sp. DSM 8431]|uniref:N-acetylmuramoyl-L-alanine amidase n=1 Tax=Clostridium sp. DSM 8431 TaxID=1761781 RepID=UPI0008E14641|nr:N-acetylmuramoyl-L-alanine amidase [Clostridium sp. DSM 8431]SFU81536.1 Putative peptidoglycan binding domain-containing protein [Clostridium sp. DSM 8431]
MKINLDMGHVLSGADTGAEGCGRKEQDCTREIGYKVKAKLEALGHSVCVCSVDNASTVNESLAARVNKANANGGDFYVSIHLNAGGGHGTEVYTYQGKELAVARNVLNNICRLGYTNRGIKGANLYVINHTTMPAILIECCFIDSSEDMKRYNAEDIANAIVKGLVGQISNNIVNVNEQQSNPSVSNDWVRRLQEECNRQGFSNQVVDGIPGGNTLAGCPTLKYGAEGKITKLFQEKLVLLGYDVGGIDGIFGDRTLSAVEEWQSDNLLEVNGVVGNYTWNVLIRS